MHWLSYLWQSILAKVNGKKLVTTKLNQVHDLPQFLQANPTIKLVILDYDDTLAGFHQELTSDVIATFRILQDLKIKLIILSNSSIDRNAKLKQYLAKFNIEVAPPGSKPNPDNYMSIMQAEQTKPTAVAVIGDRILTDLLGAYLAGISTRILVAPFTSYTLGARLLPLYLRIIRTVEIWLLS